MSLNRFASCVQPYLPRSKTVIPVHMISSTKSRKCFNIEFTESQIQKNLKHPFPHTGKNSAYTLSPNTLGSPSRTYS